MAVFLSYSRRDGDVVAVLARGFDAARHEVWFDHDLTGGEIWWDTVLRNIRSCSVFLLAVSDESLASRACMAELDYAQKLGRPVLPVQVGPVATNRSHVVDDLPMIFFRADDAVSGFAVLAAVEEAAGRVAELPDPLPAEPPIPFAYLQVVRRSIDRGGLSHSAQLDTVDQLRRALADETDVSVRAEIVAILAALQDRPWLSRGAALEVRAVLHAHRAIEAEVASVGEGAAGQTGGGWSDPPPAWPAARPDAGVDPSAEFLAHLDRVYRQMQAGRFRREAGTAGPAGGTSYFATVAAARSATTDPATGGPPAWWPSSILAVLAWAVAQAVGATRVGAVALVLLVPGAFALAAAVSSHRVGALSAGGRSEGARRASRAALACGVIALLGLAVAIVALAAHAPATTT